MKQQIIIKGEAGETNCKNISRLNGVDCQEDFTEYFDSGKTFANDVHGGYMHISYQAGKLYTIVSCRENSLSSG